MKILTDHLLTFKLRIQNDIVISKIDLIHIAMRKMWSVKLDIILFFLHKTWAITFNLKLLVVVIIMFSVTLSWSLHFLLISSHIFACANGKLIWISFKLHIFMRNKFNHFYSYLLLLLNQIKISSGKRISKTTFNVVTCLWIVPSFLMIHIFFNRIAIDIVVEFVCVCLKRFK